jgi:TolB-like protein/class 3 adenylate cyclase
MSETRKLAAILVSDVVGYSRLAGADEDRILARLRTLRSDLIDPTIAVHHGRIVKRTGDGLIVEFRSVVNAVRCAIEVQNGMIERNAGVPAARRIQFRIGIHVGDVVEESDGDLMGDGVNIAARLEGMARPGGLCLSAAANEQVRDKVNLAFADLGEVTLKNIARPVRVYSVELASESATQAARSSAPEESGPPHLSIVVLPFANLGGDASQDYFVDGVTESLTSDLSRISGSFVIARNTAYTYKSKAYDVKQIGRELNVRYVLEGSIQRGGHRIRVNVQLIEASSRSHLWAERFDKPLADLFEMQDEIVARLANALDAELITAEARRAEMVPNPDSTDSYFQGMAFLNKGWGPAYLTQARGFFERALALDPNNLDAMVGSAQVDFTLARWFLTDDRPALFAAAEKTLTKVLSSAPGHAAAHFWFGYLEIYTRRVVQGLANCERALSLDPNLAIAHAALGLGKAFIGQLEEMQTHAEQGLRLSPRGVTAWNIMALAGSFKHHLGADEEAVAWYHRALEAGRISPILHFVLGSALALLGRMDEARASIQTGLALDPTFTIHRFRIGAESDNPRFLATRERIMDGMRLAGVPEG